MQQQKIIFMAEFCIKLAGRTAKVQSLFDSTKDYCRKYLNDAAPEFTVAVTREDLILEQHLLDQEADEEGLRRRVFTDPFLERTAIQRKIAEQLLSYDVLLIHGSAIAVDGKGYLFTARTGTGKSTHTRLWRQVFGSRAVMVNDDKPFLQFTESGIFLCGAPWSGKHGLDTNITVPLQGICILERGAENAITPVSADAAAAFLCHQCQAPMDAEKLPLFTRLTKRLPAVPLWHMRCTVSEEAPAVAYKAMKK